MPNNLDRGSSNLLEKAMACCNSAKQPLTLIPKQFEVLRAAAPTGTCIRVASRGPDRAGDSQPLDTLNIVGFRLHNLRDTFSHIRGSVAIV